MSGEIVYGPGGQAAFDQAHAQAVDLLRQAKGFVLLTRNPEDQIMFAVGGRDLEDAYEVLRYAAPLSQEYLADLTNEIGGLAA